MLALPAVNCTPYFSWLAIGCSERTFAQSTSSSSAMIMGIAVSTPCPISDGPM